MGLIKRLLSRHGDAASSDVEVHGLTGTILENGEGPGPHHLWASRPQVADEQVDWPVDPATGTVFDDTWLLDGLRRSVSENSYRSKLEAREDKARLRRERLYAPGVDTVQQEADMLRGRDWLEWDEHVHQLKREGFLESALALVYEMIDVAAKSPSYDQHKVPPGWYDQAGIILRKLKRPDEEVTLLRRAEADYPGAFSDQLAKALARAEKQKAAGS